MREYIAYFKRQPGGRGQRVAIVPSPGTVNYGFGRMIQQLVDEHREVALFESRDEALAWLAQPQTPAE